MQWILAALVAGSAVFCALTVIAARRYRHAPLPMLSKPRGISVLKPLAGADDGLEDNLRSYFHQRYGGEYEVLFAVREEADPAAAVARRVMAEFPDQPARLLIVGEPPWPNAKVWSLAHLTREARFDLLAMADSDVRVRHGFLASVASEFEADPALAVLTCPYRAIPGASDWSTLEAVMMNTEFLSGILVARMLEGMRFAVGPTIVARKDAIERVGGWEAFQDFLAEDFVLGQRAADAGLGVGLSRYVIEHRIGSQPFGPNARHRLRWCRSTRRSRPAGYLGEAFTNPLPWVLAFAIAAPHWWPLGTAALIARTWAAHETAIRILRDPLVASRPWLVPWSDLASFLFWLGGFFGSTVAWRGRTYRLSRDGRFQRVG